MDIHCIYITLCRAISSAHVTKESTTNKNVGIKFSAHDISLEHPSSYMSVLHRICWKLLIYGKHIIEG